MSGSLIEVSKAAHWWPTWIDTAVCIGVDGLDVGETNTLAGEYDVELVTSALKGLHKSFE